jgi:uncharacterized protein YlxW (UPF0749 family)
MPEDQGTDPIRQRVRSALLKPSRSQVVVSVLLALLGFAAVTQVRVNQTDDSYAGLREQDLIDVLTALAGTRQRAEEEIDSLEQVRDELQSDTTRRRAALEQAQEELDELSVLAGTVPVTGPGIRVTISEEEGTVELASLLDTVQELRTADAEAIQVNGEVRVVAQTAFAPAEGGFLVDGRLVEAPYVIDVIGEPNVLAQAMEFALGPTAQLEEDGADVDVEQLPSLDIEAVVQPRDPEHANPAPGQ